MSILTHSFIELQHGQSTSADSVQPRHDENIGEFNHGVVGKSVEECTTEWDAENSGEVFKRIQNMGICEKDIKLQRRDDELKQDQIWNEGENGRNIEKGTKNKRNGINKDKNKSRMNVLSHKR